MQQKIKTWDEAIHLLAWEMIDRGLVEPESALGEAFAVLDYIDTNLVSLSSLEDKPDA